MYQPKVVAIGNIRTPLTRISIKVFVATKSEVRTSSTGVTYIACLLQDETGQITGLSFDHQAPKFHRMLDVDKVYLIKNCDVFKNQQKERYPGVNNLYIRFNAWTKVEEIPQLKLRYQYTDIDEIDEFFVGANVDIIAVITDFKDRLSTRQLILSDRRGNEIPLTLFSNQLDAYKFLQKGDIIQLKSALVDTFLGNYFLKITSITRLTMYPDTEETLKLREWHKNFIEDGNLRKLVAKDMKGKEKPKSIFVKGKDQPETKVACTIGIDELEEMSDDEPFLSAVSELEEWPEFSFTQKDVEGSHSEVNSYDKTEDSELEDSENESEDNSGMLDAAQPMPSPGKKRAFEEMEKDTPEREPTDHPTIINIYLGNNPKRPKIQFH